MNYHAGFLVDQISSDSFDSSIDVDYKDRLRTFLLKRDGCKPLFHRAVRSVTIQKGCMLARRDGIFSHLVEVCKIANILTHSIGGRHGRPPLVRPMLRSASFSSIGRRVKIQLGHRNRTI